MRDISNRDRMFLNIAAAVAKNSMLRVRVGACNSLYQVGWNRKHTHPKLAEWGFSEHHDIHAEMDIALQGHESVCGCTIYVVRLARDGHWALARPCDVCMGVLSYMDAKRVVWSMDDGEIGQVRL